MTGTGLAAQETGARACRGECDSVTLNLNDATGQELPLRISSLRPRPEALGRVTSCRPTPLEVDSMLVHATPREVNPGSATSTHIHL